MSSDIEQRIIDAMATKIVSDFDEQAIDALTGEIWRPKTVERKYMQDKWKRELYADWERVQRQAKDPVQMLRDEMKEELRDIKQAVNKMGIMLDSEAPSQEQLRKSKTLKDAYMKYKMIEKLVLGGEAK